MNTTKILAKRMIDSLHNNFVLENTQISDVELELLEAIVKNYLKNNNQINWGFDDGVDYDGAKEYKLTPIQNEYIQIDEHNNFVCYGNIEQ